MKTRNLLLGTVFLASALTVMPIKAENIKGNGNVITQEFAVEDFEGIMTGGIQQNNNFSFKSLFSSSTYTAPSFYYKQTSSCTLEITTDENIMPYLTTEVRDGNLRIRVKKGYAISPTQLDFHATSKELERISVSGGGNFYLKSSLKGDKLEAGVSGGGDLYLNEPVTMKQVELGVSGGGDLEAKRLACDYLEAGVSGGGDLDLGGNAKEAEMGVSGGGDLHAYDMVVNDLTCGVSGGGTAKVHAVDNLKAKVCGGGDLYYKGNPNADTSARGGGGVHKVN